jgi:hypothetical protein
VEAANPRYAFRLKRRPGKTDWLLAQLDVNVVDGSTVDIDGRPLREVIHNFVAQHFLRVESFIRQPTFKILRVSAVHQGGRDLVRIDFDNEHERITKKGSGVYNPYQGGWFVLDPEHYWCLVESELVGEWTEPHLTHFYRKPERSTYEYRTGSNRFPILTRVVSREKPVPELKVPGIENIRVYDLRESAEPEDGEFTLTAYGLPEPVGMPLPRRSRTWLWLSLASGGVLCLGLFFGWLARRRAADRRAKPGGSLPAAARS